MPEFYEVLYNEDGTVKSRKNLEAAAPARIKKRTFDNINKAPAASIILTPNTEFSDMYLSEITRGCGRHCRFCMAGYIYLPPRNLGIDEAKECALRLLDPEYQRILEAGTAPDYKSQLQELIQSKHQRAPDYTLVRASGPGGQNVNKVATAAQLRFDVEASPSLPPDVKARLRKLGGRRVTSTGILIIEARRYRTQSAAGRSRIPADDAGELRDRVGAGQHLGSLQCHLERPARAIPPPGGKRRVGHRCAGALLLLGGGGAAVVRPDVPRDQREAERAGGGGGARADVAQGGAKKRGTDARDALDGGQGTIEGRKRAWAAGPSTSPGSSLPA